MDVPKRTHRVSPYVFALTCMCVLSLLLLAGILIHLRYEDYIARPEVYSEFTLKNPDISVPLLFIIASLLIPLLFVAIPYETYAKLVILDDCLELRALFRSRLRINYTDIKYIGIDYSYINSNRQFWIFFRQDELPKKYIHDIVHSKVNKRNIRVQFNQNVFDALVYYLPPKLSKQLNSCYSIIRLYHEDDEEYERFKPKKKKGKKK